MNAVTCRDVSKEFALVDHGSAWRLAFSRDVEYFTALRDVSFEVPKGKFVGVLGRNGAGKSTLLRTLGGVYTPTTGRVAVFGSLSGIYELGLVGNPELTGRAYAERLLTLQGFPRARRATMVEDIWNFSELGDRFEDPLLTYSSGMGARLFFSVATAGFYDVFLIDEVLAVGDHYFQSKCWRRMQERVSQGASGVLVTHDWGAILKMCEVCHIVESGTVIYSDVSERSVRRYLYGEDAKQPTTAGYARFLRTPDAGIEAQSGAPLTFETEVEILREAEVSAVMIIERLQPGFGWETMQMTRHPTLVGRSPGRYTITYDIPHVSLEPGRYVVGLNLVMPSRDKTSQAREILDGRGWLSGNGIALTVHGESDRCLDLPTRWRLADGRLKGEATSS